MLLAVVLIAVGGSVVKGQRLYAPTLITSVSANVTNAANAVLPDESVATLNSTAGFGQAIIQVAFTSQISVGTTVFIKVSGSTGSITATAYSGASGPSTAGTLVTSANTTVVPMILPDGTTLLAVSATVPFNSVRVALAGGLLGGLTATMSYAAYEGPDTGCSTAISTTKTITGINLGADVIDMNNAIDGDLTTKSNLTVGLLGVATTIKQTVFFSSTSNAGDAVTITFSVPPAVLTLGLFNNVTVTAFNGATQVGSPIAISSVLSLDLLNLLGNGTRFTGSFVPSGTFNRVEIATSSLASVLGSFYIHEVQRTPPMPVFNTPAVKDAIICIGQTANLSVTAPTAGYENRWYSDLNGGTLLTTGNTFSPSPLVNTTYYVAAGKSGCAAESERVAATVTVNPLPVVNPITGTTTTVCVGKTITLNTTTNGGNWSSNNSNVSITAAGVVTGVTAGTSIITYTVVNANGCTGTATATVTVNPLPVITPITGTRTVCVGKTTTLGSTPTGGTWSSSTTSIATVDANTGIVTGVAAGTATITYTVTNANGCIGTASATVTVNPLPVVTAITGTTTVCVGKTTTLGSTPTGGTWSSSTTSIATVDANTGIVTGVAAGTATITYTVTNANGCIGTASATVTVNPLPVVTPITGPRTVCVGKTTTLGSTPTGGTWSSSTTSIATVDANTGIVTGVAAGTATITYTVTNANGCIGTASATVTVNPLPVVTAITGTTTICVGKTTTLSSTPTGGTWSSSTTNIATVDANTGIVTGVAAGTTTITYTVTNANGCIGTASATVTVNPLPVVTAITGTRTVCVGKTTTLGSTPTGGTWSSSTISIATVDANTGIVTGVAAGTATITYTVTNANGCIGTASATVTVNPLPVLTAITGTTTICVGKTTTLSSTPTGGTWSSSTTSIATVDANTGIVTGVAAGTATITYTVTNANGCISSISATVTINALPAVAAITGTTAICIGQTTTLSSTTPGGTWSSSDPTKATVSATTGLVTSVAPGTTTITYSVNNANGCTGTAATTVTINALPVVAPITGTTAICANQTVTLSSTTTGGQWTSSDPTKATINSTTGVLTGVAPGNTTITYTITDAITGCSNSVTTSITVKLVPTLTSALNPAVCSNAVFAYTATSNGLPGTTFSWTRALVANISNPPSSGTTNIINETLINTTMSPVNVTYIFTVTLDGCSSTTNVILKVNPKPGPPHIVSQ